MTCEVCGATRIFQTGCQGGADLCTVNPHHSLDQQVFSGTLHGIFQDTLTTEGCAGWQR